MTSISFSFLAAATSRIHTCKVRHESVGSARAACSRSTVLYTSVHSVVEDGTVSIRLSCSSEGGSPADMVGPGSKTCVRWS